MYCVVYSQGFLKWGKPLLRPGRLQKLGKGDRSAADELLGHSPVRLVEGDIMVLDLENDTADS
jgi:hypothetical protein